MQPKQWRWHMAKRYSWTRLIQDEHQDRLVDPALLKQLDDILYDIWDLGRNILLVWAPGKGGIDLLVIPHFQIGEFIAQGQAKTNGQNGGAENLGLAGALQHIVGGPKGVSPEVLQQTAAMLQTRPAHVELPFSLDEALPAETVSALVKRYSITLVEDRAVALFDIVGFSRYSPLEQVTQLNSLAYSVNVAYSKLMDRHIEIRFARANTGDGFYIWNRDRGIESNVDLYHFMHLVLAENAIAHSKTHGRIVPLLRTCFHLGGHYEFYQSEGLNPTTFSYIVGDVTIELARMIEQARPGQVLIGDFLIPVYELPGEKPVFFDTTAFIERIQPRLSSLNDLELGGDRISRIKCYLTGSRQEDGEFAVSRYLLTDKHGYQRHVYNAKINIHRTDSAPIFLGLQEVELSDFGIITEEETPHARR